MKKLLLSLLICLIGLHSNAQEPELLGTWFINTIIFGDIGLHPPVSVHPYLTFYNSTNNYLDGNGGCNDYYATLTYDSSESLYQILTFEPSSETCTPEIDGFENIFFNYFMIESYIYQYEFFIDNTGQEVLVVLLDPFNRAEFRRSPLSISDENYNGFTVYPNPAQDILRIDNTSITEITSIKLYDLLGRLVLVEKVDVDQIDVSHLDSGLLFMEIETDQGVITKKIVKE